MPITEEQFLNLERKVRDLEDFNKTKLEDFVFDDIWKRTFHYITFFESLDGFNVSGTTSIDDTKATLTTGATSGNSAAIAKQPLNQRLTTY